MANKTTSEEIQLALVDIDGTVLVRVSKQVTGVWQNFYVTFADLSSYIGGGGAVAWGSITGTLTDQTDLVTALGTKEPTIAAGTTSQYWRGDKSWQTLNAAAVGLSNVDNTSDANKPVSTAQQTALNLKEDVANKTSTVAGNTASTTLYLTVKGYFDWLLQGLTQALSAKVTPVDADSVLIEDSADSNKTKKTTWANIKATLATYFGGIYQTLAQQQTAGTALVVFRQTISAVQAQTLNSAPVVISDLPAPGAGKAWAIVELSVKYTFDTADYLFTTLTTGNTTGIAAGAGQAFTSSPLGVGGADAWCSSFIGGAGGAKTNIYENEGVEIKSDADDILVGDGTFIIYGTARLITL